mgnify:CR=1 FL=1
MCPEQIRGRRVDWRTDIYSFGVLAYELLSGRLPFTGALMEVLEDALRRLKRALAG